MFVVWSPRPLAFALSILACAHPATTQGRPPSLPPPPEANQSLQPYTPELVSLRMVVIATVSNVEAARREALRAASLLAIPTDLGDMRRIPTHRRYLGDVITPVRAAKGKIALISYLGEVPEAKVELIKARKHFPRAHLVEMIADPSGPDVQEAPFVRAGLLVVASHSSYPAALAAAQSFGRASGIPFDARGMIYDKKRGLIVSDHDADEAYAGHYVFRRDDQCGYAPCVTVERSEAYDGFRPGLYIVVAGIVGDSDADERLQAARAIVPSAYIKQTSLYMGCMH